VDYASRIRVGTLTLHPDLMLCTGEDENQPLLIVENKIGSGIGEHEVNGGSHFDRRAGPPLTSIG